jgi:hypothetical protein
MEAKTKYQGISQLTKEVITGELQMVPGASPNEYKPNYYIKQNGVIHQVITSSVVQINSHGGEKENGTRSKKRKPSSCI